MSAHTVFEGFTFTDTTEQMRSALRHFDNLNAKFDAIYTGYLGSQKQVEIVTDFINRHCESLIITDPVMGDNGRLYSGFDKSYPTVLRELCRCSDLIIPNLTEACFITNMPYVAENFSSEYIGHISGLLTELCENAVITGVREGESISVFTAKSGESPARTAQSKLIERQFHGTGDVFASTLSGMLTLGIGLKESAVTATKFTELCIQKTVSDKNARWYGLSFEPCIHKLYNMVFDDL